MVGDGANGTWLSEKGFTKQPYDLANLLAPDLVRQVHAEYLEAGADLIETNTFQANRFRLAGHDVDIREINFQGAKLAREAAGKERLVVGAIGPAGKPMQPIGSLTEQQVAESVREQALALAEGGVDGFILETYTDMVELRAAVDAIRAAVDLPIMVSKAYIEDGEMLAQGLPTRCTKDMLALGVVALGANCIVGPQRMLDLVRQIAENTQLPILAYPTPGMPQLVKGAVVYDTSPEYFAKAAARLVDEGAGIVGGCCGTTPEHIRHLKGALQQNKSKPKAKRTLARKKSEPVQLESSQPSELSQKLGHKFVVAVEMDVPRGLDITKLIAGARELKIGGADVINISDGARARLRMNPTAVATMIQGQVGIEVTMHFSCRDRNLLAIQSDLLGCHAIGVRNILAVTGDPANIGDYPSATSVFDIDAIGLIRVLSRFNEGIDLAGYSVGVKCAFTIAAAYNPTAIDPKTEWERLAKKADAGAHVIYTQPVFDLKTAEKAARDVARFGLPVLVGVLPLKSKRHAEFMHNEVPGINIPQSIRDKIAAAPDDDSASSIGIEEACKLACALNDFSQGIYLMPPFGSAKAALQVMSALT